MTFNLNELNLTDAEVSSGSVMLKPGKYIGKIKDAKVSPAKKNDGSQVLSLKVEEINGQGSINHWINLLVKSSAEATRIGRSELKTLLFYGGHPNPDRPGDISMINGLTVGVLVGGQKYVKDGIEKDGSEIKAFIDPAEVDPSKFTPKTLPPKKKGDGLEDEIPF